MQQRSSAVAGFSGDAECHVHAVDFLRLVVIGSVARVLGKRVFALASTHSSRVFCPGCSGLTFRPRVLAASFLVSLQSFGLHIFPRAFALQLGFGTAYWCKTTLADGVDFVLSIPVVRGTHWCHGLN